MYINKIYRVRFKRIVWVDTIIVAANQEEAIDLASEQADFDDQDHTSAEDSEFDVEEMKP